MKMLFTLQNNKVKRLLALQENTKAKDQRLLVIQDKKRLKDSLFHKSNRVKYHLLQNNKILLDL